MAAARYPNSLSRDGEQDPDTPEGQVAELQKYGATFRIDRTPLHGFVYRYDVGLGGDRCKCQAIVSEARAMPDPFIALFRVAVFVVITRARLGL